MNQPVLSVIFLHSDGDGVDFFFFKETASLWDVCYRFVLANNRTVSILYGICSV